MLRGLLERGDQVEDHGHAEVLFDGVVDGFEELCLVFGHVEKRVLGCVGWGGEVEVGGNVGIVLRVGDTEQDNGTFGVFIMVVGEVGGN